MLIVATSGVSDKEFIFFDFFTFQISFLKLHCEREWNRFYQTLEELTVCQKL